VALTRISPLSARVRWDRQAQRPSAVSFAGARLQVTGLRAVRDERRAYRPSRGPHLTMVVEGHLGEAQLVFDARTRRWFVEAVDLAA
jgi:hypothetical protein